MLGKDWIQKSIHFIANGKKNYMHGEIISLEPIK